MTRFRFAILAGAAVLVFLPAGCSRATPDAGTARHLLLVTVDTLRADHVGAYGYTRAQTAFIDSVAASGVRFDRAYAAAPITLPSHATILTGRYPPGHGSRDNGMRVSDSVPTLATELKGHGFRTGAFVAAFPLDHQFGLGRGFDVYGDRLSRDRAGRQQNERPASEVVDEAIAWLRSNRPDPPGPQGRPDSRIFLWVHVFEPHAPYGNPAERGSPLDRYDHEIGVASRELSRLWQALGELAKDTLVIVAGDHGEAFGEHGEYAHSIFVYDTTLRVPLVMSGPGIGAAGDRGGRSIPDAVSLADVAPTAMRLLGFSMSDVDGIDVRPAFAGAALGRRELYAESFAPFVEFGWAPLRSVRSGAWKYIAAPEPELYDLEHDAGEQQNVEPIKPEVAEGLATRVGRYSSDTLGAAAGAPDPAAAARLRALGYSSGSSPRNAATAQLPDPKRRKELAARIAQVTSGELSGDALIAALDGIVRENPGNGQAQLRLGFARLERGDCAKAEPAFHAAISAGLPSADAFLGLADCLGRRGDLAAAEGALTEARRIEPDNQVVVANLGLLKASRGDAAGGIELLKSAIAADPDFLEARFNLALVYGRAGRVADAKTAAQELLARLPPQAPQRSEVERLLRALDGRP